MTSHSHGSRVAQQIVHSDVGIPFKEYLPAGTSTFTIGIPKEYGDRQFYFDSLHLVSDYYVVEAQEDNVETDQEMGEIIDYQLSLGVKFNVKDFDFFDFEGTSFSPTATVKTPDLMVNCNNHFELKGRPNGFVKCPFFFDWTDDRYDQEEFGTWDNYVQNVMALAYYGQKYDPALHFDALPASVRDVDNSNNYRFPTVLSDVNVDHIRIRLNVGPNVTTYFSSNNVLLNLGFTAEQLGTRAANRNFAFINNSNYGYITFTARDEPLTVLVKANTLQIRLKLTVEALQSRSQKISISRADMRKNVNFSDRVKAALSEIKRETCLDVQFNYDTATTIFSFVFPTNPKMMEDIDLDPELANKMGFGLITNINAENRSGQPVSEKVDVKKLEEKARSLVYETNMVVVSDESSSANTTANLQNLFMAALFPSSFGTLDMSPTSWSPPPLMPIPTVFGNSSNLVPAKFRLDRFIDHNILVRLSWSTGAYVSGVLRGTFRQRL